MILDDLYQRKIQSVIVEGGTALLQSCIDAGLWDEAYRWISPQAIGEGITAPTLTEGLIDRKEIGDNSLWRYSIEQ
jgi:diaminohydroxyphosphoribosylaminopyrimidine deaminase/5-amino-6-(5-phosphoribosylamino)uracil reductase